MKRNDRAKSAEAQLQQGPARQTWQEAISGRGPHPVRGQSGNIERYAQEDSDEALAEDVRMNISVVDAVIEYWNDHDVHYLPGVSQRELAVFERRYNVMLPDDVRAFYRRTDGTRVTRYGQDHDSYDFWRVSEIVSDDNHPWAMNFADYREMSWWYAMDLSGCTGHGVGSVFFMGSVGGRPLVIAHSFGEFLHLYVHSDERLLPSGAIAYDAAVDDAKR